MFGDNLAVREPVATAAPTAILVDAIERMAGVRTLEDIASVVRSAARTMVGADGVAFVARDNGRCRYVDEDSIGPLWKGRTFPLEACISGWAMLNSQTVVIPDIYVDDRIPHDAYRPTFVKSLVMAPVPVNNPVAAIGAYWADQRQPTPEEIANLELIARATATALENVGLYASLTEALERRDFLIRELDHRMKNTLASALAMANQTLKLSASPEAFVDGFNGRLNALSRAHEVLARENWRDAALADLVTEAAAPYGGLESGRVFASRQRIRLAPEAAVAMMLALHELFSNAARHGALSGPEGRVVIGWSADRREEPGRLRFEWREHDGPPVSTPETRGFGSRLIERGVAVNLNGQAKLDFPPGGVVFTLEAPLSARIGLG